MGGYYSPSPTNILTAANWKTYVRDQTINQFATAAARDSAITSPADGMYADLSDQDALTRYDGSAWRLFASAPVFARRTADATAISLSTTLTDDSALFVTVVANAVYVVQSQIIYTADPSGDLLIGWSGPASASFDWGINGPGSSQTTTTGTFYNGSNTISGSDTVGGVSAVGSPVIARPGGVLVTSGTAGTFKFRWAQGTSNANGTTVKAGSYLYLTRVA